MDANIIWEQSHHRHIPADTDRSRGSSFHPWGKTLELAQGVHHML